MEITKVESKNIISSSLVVTILRLEEVNYWGGYDSVQAKFLPIFKEAVDWKSTRVAHFDSVIWAYEAMYMMLNEGVVIPCQCDVWLPQRQIRRCMDAAKVKYQGKKGRY